ncbi:MAG TPA: DUF6569 family protein [Pseudolabrys sp.]|nr:DUF6569 family protein [Pseudolabrys sp.]
MQLSMLAGSSLAVLLAAAGIAYAAADSSPVQVSGPVDHENLTVYFVHGKSKIGPVPLTLQEALAKGAVRVSETGTVNTLTIENFGDEAVFVQAGDVVKGGQQDRTLTVSLLLPPKSGRIPIASFCVEHGRWSARGAEDVKSFASSASAVPSREMKLAMQAPLPAAPAGETVGLRQQKVWAEVAKAQDRFAAATGADVRAQASLSSLQLALENKKLGEMRAAYVAALKAAGEAGDDIVGYVFAINGKLNSAEIYESNGLFRKMWPKLLEASATEAISRRNDAKDAAPSIAAVTAFLEAADAAKAEEQPLSFGLSRTTRESAKEVMFETSRAGGFVHRSYLSK